MIWACGICIVRSTSAIRAAETSPKCIASARRGCPPPPVSGPEASGRLPRLTLWPESSGNGACNKKLPVTDYVRPVGLCLAKSRGTGLAQRCSLSVQTIDFHPHGVRRRRARGPGACGMHASGTCSLGRTFSPRRSC